MYSKNTLIFMLILIIFSLIFKFFENAKPKEIFLIEKLYIGQF